MRLEKELGCLARELDGDVADVQADDGGCAWRGWEGGGVLRVDRLRDLGSRVGEAGREARKRREEAEGLSVRIRELWDEMEMLDDEEVCLRKSFPPLHDPTVPPQANSSLHPNAFANLKP
jgi:hypothetical protein